MKSLQAHFVYWILPTLLTLSCILIYFYNPYGLSYYISSESDREFGLLEHLQLILIIIIFIIAVKAVRSKEIKIEKYFFSFLAAVALFFFLEEMDYGLHYYEWLTDKETRPKIRNIHNNGNITSVFKMAAYVFIVVFFICMPFVPSKIKEKYPLVDYLSPSKKIFITSICLFVLNEVAFYLQREDFHINRSLDGNTSEFEELMTYYLCVLYIKELADTTKKLLMPAGLKLINSILH